MPIARLGILVSPGVRRPPAASWPARVRPASCSTPGRLVPADEAVRLGLATRCVPEPELATATRRLVLSRHPQPGARPSEPPNRPSTPPWPPREPPRRPRPAARPSRTRTSSAASRPSSPATSRAEDRLASTRVGEALRSQRASGGSSATGRPSMRASAVPVDHGQPGAQWTSVVEEAVQVGFRVGGEARVDGAGLDDGASRGGQPAEPFAQRLLGRLAGGGAAAAAVLHRGQRRAQAVQVQVRVQCAQPVGVHVDAAAQEVARPGSRRSRRRSWTRRVRLGGSTRRAAYSKTFMGSASPGGPRRDGSWRGTAGRDRADPRAATAAGSAARARSWATYAAATSSGASKPGSSASHSRGTRATTSRSSSSVTRGASVRPAAASAASSMNVARTWSSASYGLATRLAALAQAWWKYRLAPWSISQTSPCQTRRFGLRQLRSTLPMSASNHSAAAGEGGVGRSRRAGRSRASRAGSRCRG